MRNLATAATLTALFLYGCGPKDGSGDKAGQAAGVAVSVAPCTILSAAEASKLFGAKLTDVPAGSLPQAQTCQFVEAGGNVAVTLSKIPGRYYEEHRSKDFRKLPGIGDEASISWEMDSWRAIARSGDSGAVVTADGPAATQDNTIAILKAALAKP